MKKYKPVLVRQKELLNDIYKTVSNPNKTNKENMQAALNAFTDLLKEYQTDGNPDKKVAQLTSVSVKGLIDEMNGTVTHYFIKDESLINFLKETEIRDTSIVRDYIDENCLKLDSYASYYSIALHTENEGLFFTYLKHDDRVIVVAFSKESAVDFDLRCKLTNPISRLSVNLVYYLKAYPEKVLSGVPDDMVKNDKKKMQNIKTCTIGIADEIVEKTEVVNGHIVSPHFRSGFFRHYTDDRYVNMKGKVQFIAATMVKGKAKTVVA